MKLDRTLSPAERVDQIMRGNGQKWLGVLFQDGEDTSGHVKVDGIVADFGFHPGRLEEARAELLAIVREVVADTFYKDKGGGSSFLALCQDRNDAQWADTHKTMEALLVLSIGLGLAGYCAPRKLWSVLPGGMPYVWFDPSCRGVS